MQTSVKMLYDELTSRGIEVASHDLVNNGTLLLFEYAGQQRAISGTSPDLSAATSQTIANNKTASHAVARRLHVPTPETDVYESLEQAEQFLTKYSQVVVKPLDAAHGNGVTTNITTLPKLKQAIKLASLFSSTVLLQQQVSGVDVRILVIDGKIAAGAVREPASVVGDGVHTIAELIAIENENPLRGRNYQKPLNIIDVDASERYLGEDLAMIPAKGAALQVVGTANIGTGGKALNRTKKLPKEMIAHAELFADTIGAFTCGVDFMYDADAKSWYFIEANRSPNFGLHKWPHEGEGVDVEKIFVDRLLADYDSPLNSLGAVGVVGRNALVDLVDYADGVPAKIDTGADSSSVWASDVRVTENGTLEFVLFGPDSPHYTGTVHTTDEYRVALVRSTTGHEEIRYRVAMPVRISGKKISTVFNLSNREKNEFPILIGRRTLSKKFIVDVIQAEDEIAAKAKKKGLGLNAELRKDPRAFYEKYHGHDL